MSAARRAGIRVTVASVRSGADAVREVRRVRPAITVVDTIAFPQAAAAIASLDARRVVALAHMRVRGPAARAVLRRADRTIAVSAALARELRALGARRVAVLRPGADGIPVARARPRRPGLRLLCVANWSRAKGIDVLLDACARVPGARLDLAGDEGHGEYARRLRARVRSSTGIVSRGACGPAALARLYASCDAVVIPSREEGFGIVAAEAIAHGRPVIASDLPPLRETVGRAGALVHPGSIAALARAIASARDASLRRRWMRHARRRARRLTRWRDTERAFVSLLVAELHALAAGGDPMPPRGVKSPKRKRQYEKIKKSALKRGRSEKTAKRIAAATTNKTRRKKGETKSGRRKRS